jgi:hypothetical protein
MLRPSPVRRGSEVRREGRRPGLAREPQLPRPAPPTRRRTAPSDANTRRDEHHVDVIHVGYVVGRPHISRRPSIPRHPPCTSITRETRPHIMSESGSVRQRRPRRGGAWVAPSAAVSSSSRSLLLFCLQPTRSWLRAIWCRIAWARVLGYRARRSAGSRTVARAAAQQPVNRCGLRPGRVLRAPVRLAGARRQRFLPRPSSPIR